MDDLVEWLTQILDEDAAMAQAAIDDDGGQDGGFEDEFNRLAKGRDIAGPLAFEPSFGEACARMIVWNTPRRVLADIAAKRAMIARLNAYCWQRVTTDGGETWHLCGTCDRVGCATVRDLASGYADRPGFREEWRPQVDPAQ